MAHNLWTNAEKATLKAIYSTATIKELKKAIPNHPLGSIYVQAFNLKIKKMKRDRHLRTYDWSQIERDNLVKLYPKTPISEVILAIPKRTLNAIQAKAIEMGIKRQIVYPNDIDFVGASVSDYMGHWNARAIYPASKGIERHHKDGNPKNNSPDNIMLLTHKEHMIIDGRIKKNLRQYNKRGYIKGYKMKPRQNEG